MDPDCTLHTPLGFRRRVPLCVSAPRHASNVRLVPQPYVSLDITSAGQAETAGVYIRVKRPNSLSGCTHPPDPTKQRLHLGGQVAGHAGADSWLLMTAKWSSQMVHSHGHGQGILTLTATFHVHSLTCQMHLEPAFTIPAHSSTHYQGWHISVSRPCGAGGSGGEECLGFRV